MIDHFRMTSIAAALLLSAAASAATPLPGWQQLEALHQKDGGTEAARRDIATDIPRGTPLEAARRALVAAGARCRHKPGIEHCLIHRYSLADGAADDVRWTVTLRTSRGVVEAIKVDRSVDRHGNA